MRFLRDNGGLTAVEYIIVGAISLILIGAAVWQLAGSIARRLNAFNGAL
jgi:Flp pilus assembly pilin Flp